MARRRHDQLIHGPCGQWREDAFDPETDGEWVVDDEDVICEACAEIDRWRKDNPTVADGAQVYVRRLTPKELQLRRGAEPHDADAQDD